MFHCHVSVTKDQAVMGLNWFPLVKEHIKDKNSSLADTVTPSLLPTKFLRRLQLESSLTNKVDHFASLRRSLYLYYLLSVKGLNGSGPKYILDPLVRYEPTRGSAHQVYFLIPPSGLNTERQRRGGRYDDIKSSTIAT